jgi:hypothetical protein
LSFNPQSLLSIPISSISRGGFSTTEKYMRMHFLGLELVASYLAQVSWPLPTHYIVTYEQIYHDTPCINFYESFYKIFGDLNYLT